MQALQRKLDEEGLIDSDQWGLDGTVVRAHRAAAGARKTGGLMRENNPQTTPLSTQSEAARPKSTS